MRASLSDLLATGRVLLADGATGTNYFAAGLMSGDPPEFWTVERPDDVMSLHRQFIEAGSDIILTNTFGCNRQRLKLHKAQDRTYELARAAAELACKVVDSVARPVVVAGSVGPTGELFEPLGLLTHDDAVASFTEEIRGLKDGGADVAWIETMSSAEEVHAAVTAAIAVGLPYVATCSFDTAGRTMMGLMPSNLADVFAVEPVPPLAMGANCGVGAPDILVSLLEMDGCVHPLVTKGNCGVPHFEGTEIVYSGTPELMARYTTNAINGGARIVGGCCGTTPTHIAAMREAIDTHVPGDRPTVETIVGQIGALVNSAPAATVERRSRRNQG